MTASGFYVFNSGNSFGILEGQKDENNMKKSNYWPSRIPKYFPLYIKSKKNRGLIFLYSSNSTSRVKDIEDY